jgi:hypothetical protein|tara:strand:- start:500 stop:682 length:183 start_codon:yes stop_codon:yes gene_type:complete
MKINYLKNSFFTKFFIRHKRYINNKIIYLKENSGQVFEVPEYLSLSVKGSSTIEQLLDLQ